MRKDTVDLRLLAERAIFEPLNSSDVEKLSTSSKCALIRKILKKHSQDQNTVSVLNPAEKSIVTLNNTFNISAFFHDWQRQKRQSLIAEFTKKENRPILTAFRNWKKISNETKQYALRQSVGLHRSIYVSGLTEKYNYNVIFKEGALRRNKDGIGIVFGSFSGELKTGKSQITQYLYCGELLQDAKEAFNTAHHEATHLVQHHLAVAFHRNSIQPNHPLYNEAEYFHSIDRQAAIVPSTFTEEYKSQPNEVFAHWEGDKISTALDALSA